MSCIAIVNNKGGTGKTTIAVNLGVALSDLGKRVLLIDLDQQSNATRCLIDIGKIDHDRTISEVILAKVRADAAIIRSPKNGIDLIPATRDLEKTQREMNIEDIGFKELPLKSALKPIMSKYDYILIDCPPNFEILTRAALVAANYTLIPMQPEILPLDGLEQVIGYILNKARTKLNDEINLAGVIFNHVYMRRNLTQDVRESVEKLCDKVGTHLFHSEIGIDVKIAEAPQSNLSVLRYAPRSKGAANFRLLASEFIEYVPS